MIILFFQLIGGIFALLALLIGGYYANSLLKKMGRKKIIRVSGYENKKNEQEIMRLIVRLSECVEHHELTEIVFHIHLALYYFEDNALTVLGRPPEKIRTSIHTYAEATLDFIYESKIHPPVVAMSYSEEDLAIIAGNEEKSEEEKEKARQRRTNSEQRLRRQAVLDMINEKKNIEAYLDKATQARLQKIKEMSSWGRAA